MADLLDVVIVHLSKKGDVRSSQAHIAE